MARGERRRSERSLDRSEPILARRLVIRDRLLEHAELHEEGERLTSARERGEPADVRGDVELLLAIAQDLHQTRSRPRSESRWSTQ